MKLKNVFLSALIAIIPFCARADAGLNAVVKDTPLASKGDLSGFVGNFIKSIIGILGIVLVIMIIYGGITWMTAGGDTKKIDKAKDILKSSIIGLVICLSAYIITYAVIKGIATN